jgi:hypothetical protein
MGQHVVFVLLANFLSGTLEGRCVSGAHGEVAAFGGESFGGGSPDALT